MVSNGICTMLPITTKRLLTFLAKQTQLQRPAAYLQTIAFKAKDYFGLRQTYARRNCTLLQVENASAVCSLERNLIAVFQVRKRQTILAQPLCKRCSSDDFTTEKVIWLLEKNCTEVRSGIPTALQRCRLTATA